MRIRKTLFTFILAIFCSAAWASTPIVLSDTSNEYVASFQFIDIFEDVSKKLTINDIASEEYKDKFINNQVQLPRNPHTGSAYWIRVNVKNNSSKETHWLTEFYDSSIEKIQFYIPDGKGGYVERTAGNTMPFSVKFVAHKNFVFLLPDFAGEELTYYVRVESRQLVFMLSVIRTYERFSFYALSEYYFLGIFYGLILAMALYNLFIYITTKDNSYLFYVLYVLSNGLYSLSLDGTGFQYLWRNLPEFNRVASSITVFSMVIWALFYTKTFLNLSSLSPFLDRIIKIAIIVRIALFILEFIFLPDLKN
ncbi:MAG: hypothetical protein K2Q22_07135, partial [Cytophagales bacterium]|nr:hypothetical protein [Cytophagales bacterium]